MLYYERCLLHETVHALDPASFGFTSLSFPNSANPTLTEGQASTCHAIMWNRNQNDNSAIYQEIEGIWGVCISGKNTVRPNVPHRETLCKSAMLYSDSRY